MPHLSETHIRILANGIEQMTARRRPFWYEGQVLEIVIDGQSYAMGSASGEGCNCLIDTLRQTLPGVMCSVPRVRATLEDRHRNLPTRVALSAYLSLGLWGEILDLLWLYNEI